MNDRAEISVPRLFELIQPPLSSPQYIKCLSFAVKSRLQDEVKFSSKKSIKLKNVGEVVLMSDGKFFCLLSALQSTEKEYLSK
jgi:hypothetical protein